MPTPVAAARECLTAEAAKALDAAVSVAQRRSHAQTTSLHAVSALLSQPSSALRDACARVRSAVHSTRLQFRALELSLSVSLDRAPSTSTGGDGPPVSNSLMAAIKRSQEAQRRQQENFHLQQHSPSSVASRASCSNNLPLAGASPLVNGKKEWGESEAVRYVVRGIGKLLEVSYGRLWLIGAAASYERYEPGLLISSTADLRLPKFLPWLQISELGSAKGLNLKLEDDGVVLNSSESAMHKNLDKKYQYLPKNVLGANNFPPFMGFQCSDDKRKDTNNPSNKFTCTPSEYSNINSEVFVGKQMVSTSQSSSSFPMDFNAKQEKYTSKLSEKFQRVEGLELGDLGSCYTCTSVVCDGAQMSPTSVKSVTIDLGLGMWSSPTSNKPEKPSNQCTMEPPKECSTKFLYGSQESFIFVDLSSEEMEGCNAKFRGKTTLDYILGEFCKKPFSVVFLENVDKADALVQTSLSQAIKTGKLTDSHGREVGVKNAIFVTSFSGHQAKEPSYHSEERIVKLKGRPIKITVEHVSGEIKSQSVSVADRSMENIPILDLVNKRKFISHNELHDQHSFSGMAKRAHTTSTWHLDLNRPAEENELQVDATVAFKPFNFDALADRVLKVITSNFQKTIGSECALQIESEFMDQLLAAAYASDGDKDIENWVEEVLSGGFIEVQKRYNLTAASVVTLATCSHQTSSVYLPPSITVD
ncbi:hypothetical protein VNO78_31617 [Psophocarpus tetragonolobus]|uniref:Clp R domain-containing protein n=1 Tax=Psophocarpus tetragonolobus TaxID=3891 RepID=A0AAN9S0M4_PSOTE